MQGVGTGQLRLVISNPCSFILSPSSREPAGYWQVHRNRGARYASSTGTSGRSSDAPLSTIKHRRKKPGYIARESFQRTMAFLIRPFKAPEATSAKLTGTVMAPGMTHSLVPRQ